MYLEIAETKRTQFPPADGPLVEKPHQGVRDPNATLHQAITFSKPLTASGLPTFVYDSGRRSRCTGKERDGETGLDFFFARYYSGAQGRFSSPDPGNAGAGPESPQTWNAYAYTGNNPLIAVDPDGLDCVYTDQFSQNGSVTVVRGNCIRENDGGQYINGTIDLNSMQYDQSSGTLTMSWANNEAETGGSWTVGNMPAPPDTVMQDRMETLHRAGLMADTGVKASASIMASNALGIVAGRLVGLGIEAYLASRTTAAVAETAQMTTHAAQRAAQRGISQAAVDTAVQTAKATGNVATQTGKYGTQQLVCRGTNGITVVVETEGRNAGKAITTYWTGSKP